MDKNRKSELVKKSKEIRKMTLDMLSNLGKGHVGGSMSIVDILTVLYYDKMKVDPKNPKWEDRDRFVLSKGHAGPAVYATLAHKGYFDKELLYTLNRPKTCLPSHCDMKLTPGIDQTTGSLAQGLSTALGHAFGLKLLKKSNTVYCIVGDGELQEGQCWEVFMLAGNRKMDNFVVICDRNHGQVDGFVEEVNDIEPLADKLRAFNFEVYEVNGHDVEELSEVIDKANSDGKPSFIIANTVKARGAVGFEGEVWSHNWKYTRDDYEKAIPHIDSM